MSAHPIPREPGLMHELCALVTAGDDPAGSGLESLSDAEWESLRSLASTHGVLPLLHRTVSRSGVAVPRPVLYRMQQETYAIGRRNLVLTGELVRISRLFQREGLPVLAYKGPLLALEAYGDLASRRFEDLDFLVDRRDLPRAIEILRKEGYSLFPQVSPAQERSYYRTDCECWLANADETILIELHWAARERLYAFPLDIPSLCERSRPVRIAGADVQGLCPEDLLLVLAVHGIKHAWHQLKWIADVAGLLRRSPALDWDRVISDARRLHAERLVRLMLLLPIRTLGTALPPEVDRWVSLDPAAALLAGEIVTRMHRSDGTEPPEPIRHRTYLRAREGRREKLRYLAGMTFTPTLADWETLRLPDPLFPLYFLYRPARLLGKYGAALLGRTGSGDITALQTYPANDGD